MAKPRLQSKAVQICRKNKRFGRPKPDSRQLLSSPRLLASQQQAMIRKELLEPASIVVVGASEDTGKPGGKVLHNILSHGFKGNLYGVNPHAARVQGLPCYSDCKHLPQVDLAIIAVPARFVEEIITILATEKNCKAFIVFSAGFGETGEEGKALEQRCLRIVEKAGGTLVGPNCIGVITGNYKGVFAGPIPHYDPQGCDCVSASGATLVFLLEMAIQRGLTFRDIFSVGNSSHLGAEEVLEYWDETFDEHSSRIKLLYLENISNPGKFLKHARSLVKKGCRIAAIKAGSTEAGSRAVSSHTGTLAAPDSAVTALFRKAGVIRCYSRVELVYKAAVFSIQPLKGDRLAVITHAGGPGVMLTDILVRGGMKVPELSGAAADKLLAKLDPGSSVSNPIDFLATGTAEQLGYILDYVQEEDEVDGVVVVFGTTGMWSVDDVYMKLHEKMKNARKPIYPILPSMMQAAREMQRFHELGHVNFTDEVSLGYVLTRINRAHGPYDDPSPVKVNGEKIREVISRNKGKYLSPADISELFEAASIPMVRQECVDSVKDAVHHATRIGFPLVMKVIGPVHKTDVGGVITGVNNLGDVKTNFHALMQIKGAEGVLMQKQLKGVELYMGAKYQGGFGHQLLVGMGGIFIEVLKDVSSALVPVGSKEIKDMIRRLKSYPVIQGARGKEGVGEDLITDVLLKLSSLLEAAPEIAEMDVNPLIGNMQSLVAVDARIFVRVTINSEAEAILPIKEKILSA